MNVKKFFIILFILILIGILSFFVYKYFTNNNRNSSNNNYSSSKLSSTNNTNTNNESTNNTLNNNSNNTINTINNSTSTTKLNTNNEQDNPLQPKEEEISSFTTKIYTKDSERQNNISITCSSLNDTVIKKGETFSFCDTVGKATSSKGYQKADVFQDGKVVQALGGGNCQISTTLYNAVLNTSNLNITERHSHSNSVPYIESGKDAAVAYGSYDFKFVNNNDFDIKIKAENTKNEVIIKLFKISV